MYIKQIKSHTSNTKQNMLKRNCSMTHMKGNSNHEEFRYYILWTTKKRLKIEYD